MSLDPFEQVLQQPSDDPFDQLARNAGPTVDRTASSAWRSTPYVDSGRRGNGPSAPAPASGFDLGSMFKNAGDAQRQARLTLDTQQEPAPWDALAGARGAFAYASQLPVIGGALQGLGQTANAVTSGLTAKAYGNDAVQRAYNAGRVTNEGGAPSPFDLPATVRGLNAAASVRQSQLGSLASDESQPWLQRAANQLGSKAYEFAPYTVPGPKVVESVKSLFGRGHAPAPVPVAPRAIAPREQLALPAPQTRALGPGAIPQGRGPISMPADRYRPTGMPARPVIDTTARASTNGTIPRDITTAPLSADDLFRKQIADSLERQRNQPPSDFAARAPANLRDARIQAADAGLTRLPADEPPHTFRSRVGSLTPVGREDLAPMKGVQTVPPLSLADLRARAGIADTTGVPRTPSELSARIGKSPDAFADTSPKQMAAVADLTRQVAKRAEPPVPTGTLGSSGMSGPLVGRAIGRGGSQLGRTGLPTEGLAATGNDMAASLARQAKVHNANEAAIAATKSGDTAALERAKADVKLLGGDLGHTEARIRRGTQPTQSLESGRRPTTDATTTQDFQASIDALKKKAAGGKFMTEPTEAKKLALPPEGESRVMTIPVDRLALNRKSIDFAQVNTIRGRGARDTGPITVMHNTETGQLLVEDGHHRVAAAIAAGKKTISANVRSASYSDYVPNVSEADLYRHAAPPTGGKFTQATEAGDKTPASSFAPEGQRPTLIGMNEIRPAMIGAREASDRLYRMYTGTVPGDTELGTFMAGKTRVRVISNAPSNWPHGALAETKDYSSGKVILIKSGLGYDKFGDVITHELEHAGQSSNMDLVSRERRAYASHGAAPSRLSDNYARASENWPFAAVLDSHVPEHSAPLGTGGLGAKFMRDGMSASEIAAAKAKLADQMGVDAKTGEALPERGNAGSPQRAAYDRILAEKISAQDASAKDLAARQRAGEASTPPPPNEPRAPLTGSSPRGTSEMPTGASRTETLTGKSKPPTGAEAATSIYHTFRVNNLLSLATSGLKAGVDEIVKPILGSAEILARPIPIIGSGGKVSAIPGNLAALWLRNPGDAVTSFKKGFSGAEHYLGPDEKVIQSTFNKVLSGEAGPIAKRFAQAVNLQSFGQANTRLMGGVTTVAQGRFANEFLHNRGYELAVKKGEKDPSAYAKKYMAEVKRLGQSPKGTWEKKVWQQAQQYGSRQVWTNKNEMGGMAGKVMTGLLDARKSPTLGGNVVFTFQPFVNLVTNLAREATEYVPGVNIPGLIGHDLKAVKKATGRGLTADEIIAGKAEGRDLTPREMSDKKMADRNLTPEEISARRTHALVGGLATYGLAQAALGGNLTGDGPSDKNKLYALLDTGWKPNSIRIAGRWVQNRALGPLGILLDTVGSTHDNLLYNTAEADKGSAIALASATLSGLISGYSNQLHWVDGAMQLADTMLNGTKTDKENYAASLISGFIPLPGGQGNWHLAERMTEDTTPHVDSKLPIDEGIAQRIRRGYPGSGLPPGVKRSTTGLTQGIPLIGQEGPAADTQTYTGPRGGQGQVVPPSAKPSAKPATKTPTPTRTPAHFPIAPDANGFSQEFLHNQSQVGSGPAVRAAQNPNSDAYGLASPEDAYNMADGWTVADYNKIRLTDFLRPQVDDRRRAQVGVQPGDGGLARPENQTFQSSDQLVRAVGKYLSPEMQSFIANQKFDRPSDTADVYGMQRPQSGGGYYQPGADYSDNDTGERTTLPSTVAVGRGETGPRETDVALHEALHFIANEHPTYHEDAQSGYGRLIEAVQRSPRVDEQARRLIANDPGHAFTYLGDQYVKGVPLGSALDEYFAPLKKKTIGMADLMRAV